MSWGATPSRLNTQEMKNEGPSAVNYYVPAFYEL